MKKLNKAFLILLPLVILAACGNGTTTNNDRNNPAGSPPSAGYTIPDLAEYDIGNCIIPSGKKETMELFNEAFMVFQGPGFGQNSSGGLSSKNRIARAAAHSFEYDFGDQNLQQLYAPYGISNMKGKYWGDFEDVDPDTSKITTNYDFSYNYDSNNDKYLISTWNASDFVKAKVAANGDSESTIAVSGSGENISMSISMDLDEECSYAAACVINGKGAKFILSYGLSASMQLTFGSTVENFSGEPEFYGTLWVYDNSGKLRYKYDLTAEELYSYSMEG